MGSPRPFPRDPLSSTNIWVKGDYTGGSLGRVSPPYSPVYNLGGREFQSTLPSFLEVIMKSRLAWVFLKLLDWQESDGEERGAVWADWNGYRIDVWYDYVSVCPSPGEGLDWDCDAKNLGDGKRRASLYLAGIGTPFLELIYLSIEKEKSSLLRAYDSEGSQSRVSFAETRRL